MFKQNLFSKAAFFTAAFAGSSLLPAPVSAQNSAGENVYVDLGRWTIYERGRARNCVLRSASQGGVSVAYFKSGSAPSQLNVQAARSSVFVGNIVIAFDDDEFPARLVGQATYAPLINSDAIETAFRQARTLSVRHGDITVAQISLQTSSAGFRLLKQCAEQGRIGMLQAPAPRAERPAQTRRQEAARPAIDTRTTGQEPNAPSQQASLARDPVPTNRANWVSGDDYTRFNPGNWNGGVLQYTLVVDARGRPGDCIVNSSSGSREFDQLTCRNLQRRARFNPALDASGQPAAGRFSGSIAYEIPQ